MSAILHSAQTHSDTPSRAWERQLAKLAVSAGEDNPSDRSYDPKLEEDDDEEEYDDEWTGCGDQEEGSSEDSGYDDDEEWTGFAP